MFILGFIIWEILNFLRKTLIAAKNNSNFLSVFVLPGKFPTWLTRFGRCGNLPLMREGRAVAQMQGRGGKQSVGVCLFKLLPSLYLCSWCCCAGGASPEEGHTWIRTQSKTLCFISACSSNTFWQWHLQAAALHKEGWLGAVGEYVHEHERVCFKMANTWKLAFSRGFCRTVGELWPGMRLFPAVVSQV